MVKNHQQYIRYTWFLLVMVFLVIIAGGVVRMTQSGMGCPDWPRCFGRWVPPTDASQLPPDFEKYLGKQDIDHTFNAYHTWIEYINRLLGALLGVFIFIHFIWSFVRFRKNHKAIVWLSFFLLITTGFQGWLGKKVVDHNLAVVKVTIHMLVALLIAAIPLIIIHLVKKRERSAAGGASRDGVSGNWLKYLTTGAVVVLLIQIVLGTQVREQIDEISKSLGYQEREVWISRLDQAFLIHRSFSWLVLAICIAIMWKARPYPALQKDSRLILLLVLATVGLGLIMMWAAIPAWAQPAHLLLASMLVLAVFNLRLRLK
ncbi:COX15/CtaA family protein [Terrimonas sp. NA20]|uniref:COX15/CtaA family protein n=1 Tax=Terrimonas ginsenosidimutans TaxID=2908004 RepID=A0ABS9KLH1_9BACT|nr:COX15/CtaA family protein [Terrimonas ginsenosidimutans]